VNVPNGELRLVDDVPGAFAGIVLDTLREAAGRRVSLALSGGDTARLCYELLAGTGGITWEHVECFLGDERCVPPDDPDANQRMIRHALLDKVDVAAFHPMACERELDYDALIAARLPIDVVHLGLGPDGHTASLFPGSPALEAPAGRLVVRNVDPSGSNPHERMTFTFEAIARCRHAVFTVSGESKHDALHRILEGEPLPAARVRAQRVTWLCDRDALGEDVGRVV
jgi:6-phosphogluconolactonase